MRAHHCRLNLRRPDHCGPNHCRPDNSRPDNSRPDHRGPNHRRPDHAPNRRLNNRGAGLLAAGLLAAASVLACSPYRLAPPPAEPGAVVQPFTTYIDGAATVCVIRSAQIALAVTFTVHDNALLVGATRGPTYFCYRAEPGRHRIAITGDDGEQRFDVLLEPRARYYLDQRLRFDLGFVVPEGAWVDEITARQLLRRSEHRVIEGAPASELLLTGTEVVPALPLPP